MVTYALTSAGKFVSLAKLLLTNFKFGMERFGGLGGDSEDDDSDYYRQDSSMEDIEDPRKFLSLAGPSTGPLLTERASPF